MKKILLILLVFSCTFSGCTKGEYAVYEDEISSKVYFVQAVTSAVATVSEASLNESGTVEFCIYNAGNNKETITVNVIADQDALDIYNVEKDLSMQMLPEKYWSIAQSTFIMDTEDNYQAFVKLALDFKAAAADGLDIGSYLLPLSLVTPSMKNVTYDYRTLFIQMSL